MTDDCRGKRPTCDKCAQGHYEQCRYRGGRMNMQRMARIVVTDEYITQRLPLPPGTSIVAVHRNENHACVEFYVEHPNLPEVDVSVAGVPQRQVIVTVERVSSRFAE